MSQKYKKIIKDISYFVLALLLIDCNTKSNSDLSDIYKTIDSSNYQNIRLVDNSNYKIDSLKFEDVKYIVLETNENCLIGQIKKIKFRRNNIFIYDREISNSLFMFDMNGKFIRKIGNRGKGPNEYITMEDFDLDDADGIYIYDQPRCRIIKFNENGENVENINLPIWGVGFGLITDNLFYIRVANHLFDDNTLGDMAKYTLFYWDNIKRKIVYAQFPHQGENWLLYGNEKAHSNSQKPTFYKPAYSDNIYELAKSGAILRYSIITDTERIPIDELNKMSDEEAHVASWNGELGVSVTNFYETNSIISCSYYKNKGGKKNFHHYFKSKKSGKVITGRHDYRTDIIGGYEPYGSYNEYFYNWINNSSNFINAAKNNSSFNKGYGHLSIVNTLKTLKEDNNPLIVLFKIKDF